MDRQTKWDIRFLSLAREISGWSKDPSTKVGAVLVKNFNQVVSLGYNGFARKIEDLPSRLEDRTTKYGKMIHAEMNAVLHAERDDMIGATIYTWPFMPCHRCAQIIIETGIRRVVSVENKEDRWKESFDDAKKDFEEAGLILVEYQKTKLPETFRGCCSVYTKVVRK